MDINELKNIFPEIEITNLTYEPNNAVLVFYDSEDMEVIVLSPYYISSIEKNKDINEVYYDWIVTTDAHVEYKVLGSFKFIVKG